MEDIQVIPSCHDGGMVSLIQSHALLLVFFCIPQLESKRRDVAIVDAIIPYKSCLCTF